MHRTKRQNISDIKGIIKCINSYQLQLDDLLEYLDKNADKPEFVADKIIIINDLNEDIRAEYLKLLKICAKTYLNDI